MTCNPSMRLSCSGLSPLEIFIKDETEESAIGKIAKFLFAAKGKGDIIIAHKCPEHAPNGEDLFSVSVKKEIPEAVCVIAAVNVLYTFFTKLREKQIESYETELANFAFANSLMPFTGDAGFSLS